MEPDLLKHLAEPLRQRLIDLLAVNLPASWHGPVAPLVDLTGLIVVAAGLAALGRAVITRNATESQAVLVEAMRVVPYRLSDR